MPHFKNQPMHASSSEAVTNNVRVEVESHYAPDHSQPFQNHWFFHYTIKITNEGDDTVQLLSRHWIITDAEHRVQEVRGEGVVGEQPQLAPGESFTYSSFCPLPTPLGSMRGSYRMRRDDGSEFEAPIPVFTLATPHCLN